MSRGIGTQLIAPDGYKNLYANRTYYFLGRHGQDAVARFAHFTSTTRDGVTTFSKAHITTLSSSDFENGLALNHIHFATEQHDFPIWLESIKNISLEEIESRRPGAKQPLSSYIERRYQAILPLLERLEEILSSQNPMFLVAQHARQCEPKQNPTRLMFWFLSYLSFGSNKRVLLPSFGNIGKWSREEKFPGKKFGRKSLHRGALSGYGMTDCEREKIYRGFEKHARLGQTFKSVYEDTLKSEFGCLVRKDDAGDPEIYHPDGYPFPERDQFRRVVMKKYEQDNVQKQLYGASRTRNKKNPSRGKYSENVAYAGQVVEADGYYVREVPRGFIDDNHIEPLCVVRGKCNLTGMILGIGFCFGKENIDAYRTMLFSMAIPKDEFGEYFGIKISRDDWPSHGLPSKFITDRGPGSSEDLIKSPHLRPAITTITPSYSGQSKATIESSNPRNRKIEGQPTFIESDKTYIELMRREVLRCIQDNQSTDTSARSSNAIILSDVSPSPIGLWRYYEQRMRMSVMQVPRADAIRNFLTKQKFSVKEDGVYLQSMRFTSDELSDTGIFSKAIGSKAVTVNGYSYSAILRHVWVEVKGELYPASVMHPVSDIHPDISTPELEKITQLRAENASKLRKMKTAAAVSARINFEEVTGKSWFSGRRRSGKPNRKNTASKQEYAAARFFGNGSAKK